MASFASRSRTLVVLIPAVATLAACATPHPRLASRLPGPSGDLPSGAGGRYKVGDPYQVAGVWYVPKEQPNYDETGVASWYGDEFNMKPTANGEIFDMAALSAAHTTLPLPSIVEVTNLDNGRKLQVRVNDRGPFVGGRLIDLSHAAARELGYDQKGLAHVRVRYVGPAPLGGSDVRYASNTPRPAYPSPASAPLAPVAPVAVAAMPAFVPPQPVAVAATPLAPVTPGAEPAAQPVMAAAAPQGVYRVQAGAFSDAANAQRVATQLGGTATVEPVQRNGVTLYRVVLQSSSDEGEAWALRDRVAASGYGDARVLRP
jgi:rare lipoprotein A